MKLRVLIYTTSRDFSWLQEDFPAIKKTVERGKGIEVLDINLRYFNSETIRTTTRHDNAVRPNWEWFKENLTKYAEGYNAVCFHFTDKEKKQWGIHGINGVYNNDSDEIFEFAVIADEGEKAKRYTKSEFWRIFCHELGHGALRFTSKDSDLIHHYDYQKHDLDSFYRDEVDFRRWDKLAKKRDGLLAKLKRLLNLKNKL